MTAGDPQFRAEQRADLLRFGSASRTPSGFGYLDVEGAVDPNEPMPLYVVCRMTHIFSLGVLADEPPAGGGPDRSELKALAAHGVQALAHGPLHDAEHGGWFASIASDGTPEGAKQAYAHSFVLLAATSAVVARVPGAEELLRMAVEVMNAHFWDEDAGAVVEEWDAGWTSLDDYRGVNANMHTVEAFLAAGDVTGDRLWHVRAGRIAARVVGFAVENSWRIPEHFSSEWVAMMEYNRDDPANAFRPYGATGGHGMEWARLLIAVDSSLGQDAPRGLVDAAVALNDRAIADCWAVDGSSGFVYTTGWDGTPVVRARMHWVVAEAICTATVLHRVTKEQRYADDLQRWWDYAQEYLIDHRAGSWHHELNATNEPAFDTWSGKPDVYHAYQAALMADVPVAPSFAAALAQRGDAQSKR